MSLIKNKLQNECIHIIVYETLSEFNLDFNFPNVIFYVKETNEGKMWNENNALFENIEIGEYDIIFINSTDEFPSQPENINSLFVVNNSHIYAWDNDEEHKQYFYFKQVSTIDILMLLGRFIRYNHPSLIKNISKNVIYYVGFDTSLYVASIHNLNDKKRITTDQILTLFEDISGQTWEDLFDDYDFPKGKVFNYLDVVKGFLNIYDVNRDGIVDTSNNSRKLQGKTPAYYLNRENHKGVQNASSVVGLNSIATEGLKLLHNNVLVGEGINKINFENVAVENQETNQINIKVRSYAWKEIYMVVKGNNQITVNGDIKNNDYIEIYDTIYGCKWFEGVHWNVINQTIVFTSNMPENIEFVIINWR